MILLFHSARLEAVAVPLNNDKLNIQIQSTAVTAAEAAAAAAARDANAAKTVADICFYVFGGTHCSASCPTYGLNSDSTVCVKCADSNQIIKDGKCGAKCGQNEKVSDDGKTCVCDELSFHLTGVITGACTSCQNGLPVSDSLSCTCDEGWAADVTGICTQQVEVNSDGSVKTSSVKCPDNATYDENESRCLCDDCFSPVIDSATGLAACQAVAKCVLVGSCSKGFVRSTDMTSCSPMIGSAGDCSCKLGSKASSPEQAMLPYLLILLAGVILKGYRYAKK